MTVCIAAGCSIRNHPAVVLCHDWQGTVQTVGSSDSVDKQRYLGNGWIGLIAGEIAHAEELTAVIEGSLPELPSLDVVVRIFREKVFDYRERLLDQHLRGSCGIGFDRFINDGTKIYPESVFKEIHRGLLDVQVGVELIVSGFVQETDSEGEYQSPCIMQVCSSPTGQLEVSVQDSYSCIGEGASSAQASLLFREHDRLDGLQKTTYAVFEAKRMAEIIPTVGPSTSIYLQRPQVQLASISEAGFETCERLFKVYGPKNVTRKGLKENPITPDVFQIERRVRSHSAPRKSQTEGATQSDVQT